MPEFNKWTVKSLKEYCKEHNIKIPTGSKKSDIVSLIGDIPDGLEVESIYDPITEQRQDIIKRVLETCKKDGVKKILSFFKEREKNNRLKQVFTLYKLDLQDPSTKEIRCCLKYCQELYKYSNDEKLLINQMITQIKYIDPNYIDPRLDEFKRFHIESATYDIPISGTKKQKSLNETMRL